MEYLLFSIQEGLKSRLAAYAARFEPELGCVSESMALRPRAELDAAIRSRIARVAVGPSSVRGNPAGTTDAARRFLRGLPLGSFATCDRAGFIRVLDYSTSRMQAVLPTGAGHWGLARKLLNIYLRDCVYAAHLRSAYGLGRIEPFCEVPLDSITAGKLRKSDEGSELPSGRVSVH